MNLTATLYFMQVSEIRISDVQVRNSTGVGLLGINALASLSQTTFTANAPNCILMFSDNPPFLTTLHTTQTITDSIFQFGSPQKPTGYASGLTMVFTQSMYIIDVTVSNVTVRSNRGDNDDSPGNMLVILDKCSYQCTSIEMYRVNSTGAVGDGMALEVRNISGVMQCNQSCVKSSTSSTNTSIVESNFSSNSGRGIFILQTTVILKLRIESTTFHSNVKDGLYSGHKNYIDLFDTSFSQNQRTAITAYSTRLNFLRNNTFAMNTGYWGAVILFASAADFFGNTKFIGNKGEVNGAIAATYSTLMFRGNAHIIF